MKLFTARYPIHLTCIRNDNLMLKAIDTVGGRLLLDEVSSEGRFRDFHFEAEEVTEEFKDFLQKNAFEASVTITCISSE